MNDRIRTEIELDKYSDTLERQIGKYERLYDLWLNTNPEIALRLGQTLDALYASRHKETME
jgi:hypothetical protein